jgi:tripartite ATP-independent transporter DctM subunit
MIVLLFVILFALISLGVSIWASMGISGAAFLLIQNEVSLKIVASKLIEGVDSETLVAIPFFMLTGELMGKAGLTAKLTQFANFFVGHRRGGLAYVTVLVNMIMAGVSGSAPAGCAAVSSILLPAMDKAGYKRTFAAAINAAAAVVGPIIPPSIPMIFMGVISGISIGRLFLGGVIPGLMIVGSLCLLVWVFCRSGEYAPAPAFSNEPFWPLFKLTVFAVIAPLIIIAGIVFGIVTVVEVAVLANVYILFISFFVYRSLTLKDLLPIFSRAAVFSTSIMIIFSVVGLYQYVVSLEQLGDKLFLFVAGMNMGKYTFLALSMVFFLFMGCLIDAIPIMLIFFPVLLPVAVSLGIDQVHFGVIVVVNLMLGLLTPPIGALLFLEAKIANIPFGDLVKNVLPFVGSMLAVLLLITYLPFLVTMLPNLIFD